MFILTQVGNDHYGNTYIDHLIAENVNINHVTKSDAASSGVAAIAVDDKGVRTLCDICTFKIIFN